MSQAKIHFLLQSTLASLGVQSDLDFKVNIPPRKELGDYASNIAILHARKVSRNPMELAKQIAQKIKELDKQNVIKKIEVAKPGFINLFLADSFLQDQLTKIRKQNHAWGKSKAGKKQKILLEFVSANPTGPLHVGHGRWAIVGDAISRLLEATGCKVDREYYINNVGKQVDLFVKSVEAARSSQPVPEGGYGGTYIKEIKGKSQKEMLAFILKEQKQTLENLGVKFKNWFCESDLHKKNKIVNAIKKLSHLGTTFNEGGAVWFRAEDFGDDKNRVLVREDGNPTYFAADIAYHLDKYLRKYDHIIDIWGTDHHGYVKRLKSAIQALEQPVEKLEIIIGQLVTLFRGKEAIRMSKRSGEMITLQEVVDEIGADATRFFFSATDVNSHLDFDLELAKKKSQDNPVYYVQYAHARICSILKKAEKPKSRADLSGLVHPAERNLMFKLLSWPDVVSQAAQLRHPHRITEYGKELATCFHSFYEKCKVLGNPARLVLVDASRIVLRNMLELLGVSAPESM